MEKWFTEASYTHEDDKVLLAAFLELERKVGRDIVKLEKKNKLVLRYPQIAYEEVALPIIMNHQLKRCKL
ncbi:hypothetical protein [Paenibacillus polymyxa]|uniref:hypothetical protein n=1 Tax=Paenibacillus polymyxa TaxID=1406 RepID=UPI0032AFDA6E